MGVIQGGFSKSLATGNGYIKKIRLIVMLSWGQGRLQRQRDKNIFPFPCLGALLRGFNFTQNKVSKLRLQVSILKAFLGGVPRGV